MLRHVVSWKLATDDPERKSAQSAEIRRRITALVPLVSSIRELTVGADTATTTGNWDLVLIADYDDADGLAAYQTHPEHRKVAAFIRSVISDRTCVDFVL
ncbi:Dabb family protein [Parafrigoribacterium mesophilum]|uniref:Dabb family protein n=1 Tax=Parafrigoribacterium mesophilum TaxID=433646 RepID=UPI0031FD7155